MGFFKTKIGKEFLIYFIIYFITSLFCGANFGFSLITSITAVLFIFPLTLLFGAFLDMFNIKKLKELSVEDHVGIIFVLEWIYIIMLASSLPKHPAHQQSQISNNYNSYNEQNYIQQFNSQPVYQQPIPETIKIINGITYNIVPLSETESIYSTSPEFDSESSGYMVKVIYPETNKIITIAMTSTNCSVFNKRMNKLSTLNPQIYVDGQLKDIFSDRGGITIAKYICNYKKEN